MRATRFTDEQFEMHGVTVLCSGTYYPGSPGRYSGPPEDCYPAEPDELEIESVTVGGVDIIALVSDAFLDRCDDELRARIYERANDEWEAAAEMRSEAMYEDLVEQA